MMNDFLKKHEKLLKTCAVFTFGGTGYVLLEKLWRGYSHTSMFVAGGLSLIAISKIAKTKLSFPLKCLASGGAICLIELASGLVVNVWLGLNVWDYSGEKYNILGQVCPKFFVLWSALSGIVILAASGAGKIVAAKAKRL